MKRGRMIGRRPPTEKGQGSAKEFAESGAGPRFWPLGAASPTPWPGPARTHVLPAVAGHYARNATNSTDLVSYFTLRGTIS